MWRRQSCLACPAIRAVCSSVTLLCAAGCLAPAMLCALSSVCPAQQVPYCVLHLYHPPAPLQGNLNTCAPAALTGSDCCLRSWELGALHPYNTLGRRMSCTLCSKLYVASKLTASLKPLQRPGCLHRRLDLDRRPHRGAAPRGQWRSRGQPGGGLGSGCRRPSSCTDSI